MPPLDTKWRRDATERKLWRYASGRAIRYLRRRHQMPQTELARLLDIPQPQLSKYESGHSRIDDVVAIQLAQALGVEPPRFFEAQYRFYCACRRLEDAGLFSSVLAARPRLRGRSSSPSELEDVE